jgi:MFS family permease
MKKIINLKKTMPRGLVEFYAMQMADSFSKGIWTPLTAVYILALGGNILHLGELTAVFGVAYTIGSYIVAKIGLRYRYNILPIAYGFIVIYYLVLIFINSIDHLYFVMFFGSLAASLMGPSLKGIPLDFIDHKLYVIFEQKQQMLMSIIVAIAGYLGALFIHHSGNHSPHISQQIIVFKSIFIGLSIFSLAVFIYSLFFLKRYKYHQTD